jgi:site-specific DNA-methyltransferase (adenine-specific)
VRPGSASTDGVPVGPTDRPYWETADGAGSLWAGDQASLFSGIEDASIDCIWTDPPYFLSNDGQTCRSGRRSSVNKGDWDRSRGLTVDAAWTEAWLSQCWRVLKPHGSLWVSGTLHGYLLVGASIQRLGFKLLNDIVWEKPNPPPNLGCRCFTHSTEIVLWASKPDSQGKSRHVFNYAEMRAANQGRQMKNVWRLQAPGAAEKQHGRHPTQKPVALIERCLVASTHTGDRVLDPFAGSGSTGAAALPLGRRFIGFEQDPEHIALAARRLEALVSRLQSEQSPHEQPLQSGQ